MGNPDVWVLVLQIAGILLIIASGVLLYRTSIRDAERRRDAGMTDQVQARGRVAAGLLRVKTAEGVAGDELLPLQLLAQTLIARRPLLLFYSAFPLTQLGVLFLSSPWWQKTFWLTLSAVYLVAAIQIERQARTGAAFLKQYPPAASA